MSRDKRGVLVRLFLWCYLSYFMRDALLVPVKRQRRMAVMSEMFSLFLHRPAASHCEKFHFNCKQLL